MSIETREDAVKIIANQMLGIINKNIDRQGVFQFYWGKKSQLCIIHDKLRKWKTYTVADGLVSPEVTTIFQDRLGHLWVGARTGGVSR